MNRQENKQKIRVMIGTTKHQWYFWYEKPLILEFHSYEELFQYMKEHKDEEWEHCWLIEFDNERAKELGADLYIELVNDYL